MDVLATGLFDMIATLGIKLAKIDGECVREERDFITSYFVDEWGYDPLFVQQGLRLIEEHSDQYSVEEVTEQLARFKKANPDCNYRSMSREIITFLHDIAEADGSLDEREEVAIERAEAIFEEINSITTNLSESARAGVKQVSRFGKSTLNGLGAGLDSTKKRLQRLKTKSREKLSRRRRSE